MNGNELLKKLKQLGKQNNITVRFEMKRGKGSHGTLYYVVSVKPPSKTVKKKSARAF